jgi:hypothetical protein
VSRLVLTHVPPWHDPENARAEAAEVFSGPIDLAVTGATYVMPPLPPRPSRHPSQPPTTCGNPSDIG